MSGVRVLALEGFADPRISAQRWEGLLDRSPVAPVFLSWHWQRAWWETLGTGSLLLLAAERAGEIVAVAPFYHDGGMVFLIGAGGSDSLDLIGDVADPEVLDALLATAIERTDSFVGLRLHLIPDGSPTGPLLLAAAKRLSLSCADEDWEQSPRLDLRDRPRALAAAARRGLVTRERRFQRDGTLIVRHLQDGALILPYIEEFFAAHIARRAATDEPSHFLHPPYRAFIERLTRLAADTGWLRFTRIEWQGRAIAHHYGTSYRGLYHWYNPSFAIDLAKRAPGQVLLRQVLLAAIEEGAAWFDFGLGEEDYKARFASDTPRLRTWGLYPVSGRGSGRGGDA